MQSRITHLIPPPLLWGLIVTILLGMGALRTASLVLNDPILAFASNSDPIRTQACYQIWSQKQLNAEDAKKYIIAPEQYYYAIDAFPALDCYLSSNAIWDLPVVQIHRLFFHDRPLDIRWIGVTKATILLLIYITFCIITLKRRMYCYSLWAALAYFAILSDPIVTLYANTFYLHYGSLIYISLALCTTLLISSTARPSICIWLGWVWGIVGLGLSMQQNRYMPLVLLAIIGYTISQRRMVILPMLIYLISTYFVYAQDRVSDEYKRREFLNNLNVYYYVLQEYSPDLSQALSVLSLPDSCGKPLTIEQAISLPGWYDWKEKALSREVAPCPEAGKISKGQVFVLLLRQPSLAASALWDGLLGRRNSALYLFQAGQVEGNSYLSAKSYSWLYYSPFEIFYFMNSDSYYKVMVSAIFILGVIFSVTKQYRVISGLLTMVSMYSCVAVVFGDGFEALPRHLLFFNITLMMLLLLQIVACICFLMHCVFRDARGGIDAANRYEIGLSQE